jgi:CBS domain containing-hemolysin-like protein
MELSPVILLVLKLLAVVVLVVLNGFFVAAEFALVKVRETQLQPLITKGHRRARVALGVLRNLDASLSACQLGITLASLGLGWIGEPVFTSLLAPVFAWLNVDSVELRHTLSFLVGFAAITFLHITAGEQAPKWLAIQKPLPTALLVASPLAWFHRLSYPFIWLLNHSSLWLLARVGIEPASEAELAFSEEELRLMVAAPGRHAGPDELGRKIMLNAIDLRRRIAREVMRPRREIVAFDTTASLEECCDLAEHSRYSRFPLCEGGDLDRMHGVVHIKDLYAIRSKVKGADELVRVARKLIYVPETARLEQLLRLLLDRKLHFAIVIDEYGGTVGLVTLENILEELVGQIQDEFDQEKPLLLKLDEVTWEVSGLLPLHDLANLVGEPLREEGITTVSGWVTHRLGGFPKRGDVIPLGLYHLTVEDLDGPRVARLQVHRTPPPKSPATPDPSHLFRS